MNRSLAIFGVILSVLIAACAPVAPPAQSTPEGTYTETTAFNPTGELAAKQFTSEEELISFLRHSSTTQRDFYYRGGVMMAAESAPSVGSKSSDIAADSSGGSASYSGTNNQVASVDEADIIKTDGEYIYTVSGTTVFIIKAHPGAEAEIVSRIELESQPSGLFIEDGRLAVFGNFYNLSYFNKVDFRPRNGMTYVNLYDITDKANPQLTKEYKLEGNYFQGRMHEGHMYFVVNSYVEYNPEYPMPLYFEGTTRHSLAVSDIYYFPVPYSTIQYVTVHSIDLGTNELTDSKTVAVEGSNTLYMSEDNIYLAYTKYINEWEIRQDVMMDVLEPKLTAKDLALIEKIKKVDDEVLTQAEKDSKIFQVYNDYLMYIDYEEQKTINEEIDTRVKKELEKYDSYEYTIINRIGVEDGEITVGPTGQVPGHLNNQFALDEDAGVLRVATTLSPRWWSWPILREEPMVEPAVPVDVDGGVATDPAQPVPATTPPSADESIAPNEKMAPITTEMAMPSESTNNVYTLDENLKVLDSLENLAPGETIYSTRFIGERLYMVTFRQVDPLFVIDLSDPNNIKQLGSLKVPGFSRYLHPYDENIVIGLGRDATDLGRQQGLKIALFDVSDVTKPKQLVEWVAEDEYSQSIAEWEHKAFLFDKEKELLVIPGYSYNWDYYAKKSKDDYNGALVFHITPSEIELRGIIDHSGGQANIYYGALVERSLFIEDELFTKSPSLLRINSLDDLHSVKNLTLSGTNAGPYPIY
jgi:inhibitor of cysteine peptidase